VKAAAAVACDKRRIRTGLLKDGDRWKIEETILKSFTIDCENGKKKQLKIQPKHKVKLLIF